MSSRRPLLAARRRCRHRHRPRIAVLHHLFVSYSRKDRAFVERLASALTAQGRDAWVDWEDIPPTATFLDEIRRAIEAADSFIFVISPDSCSSAVCRLEIEHAAKNRKRLIPLLLRDVPPEDVPPELAPVNWIFFAGTADFDDAFALMTRAIDTDLEWVKAHTELLVRATAWEQGERSRTALLRGAELSVAEQRLVVAADGRQPAVTSLQQDFVLTSRKAATRTLRVLVGWVSAALLITIALAVAAFVLYRRADERAHIAESRRLAADARTKLAAQLDLAMLLAIESFHHYPTYEARNALLDSLQQSPYLKRFLHGHTHDVLGVAFSPDGKRLVSCGGNEMIVWDVGSGKAIKTIPGQFWATSSAFNADGSLFGVTTHERETSFFDARNWQRIGPTVAGRFAHFAPDGNALLVQGRGTLSRLDVRRQMIVASKTLPLFERISHVTAVSLNRDGSIIATEEPGIGVHFWDAKRGARLNAPAGVPNPVETAMTFDPMERFVLLGDFNGELGIWDVATGRPSGNAIKVSSARLDEMASARLNGLAMSNDGALIATASSDRQVRLWSASSRKQIGGTLSAHRDVANHVAFSPDGKLLASASADSKVIVWDVIAPQENGETFGANRILADIVPVGRPIVFPPQQSKPPGAPVDFAILRQVVSTMRFDCDAHTVAIGKDDGSVSVWDLQQRRRRFETTKFFSLDVRDLALSPDGQILAAAGADQEKVGRMELLDAATGKRLMDPFRGAEFLHGRMAFSPDGKTLVIGSDNRFMFLDVAARKVIAVGRNSGINQVVALEFEPDGRRFVAAGNVAASTRAQVVVWDVEARRQLRALRDGGLAARRAAVSTPATPKSVLALALSPDGKLLALATEEGMVFVYNARTLQAVAVPFQASPTRIDQLGFSRDSQFLVVVKELGVQLWDVETRQPIGGMISSPPFTMGTDTTNEAVGAVAFARDGKSLFTAYPYSESVVRWDIDPESWTRRLCAAVNRNLTNIEWQQYMGAIPYRETCPQQ